MLDLFREFFIQLAEDQPRWNFIFFYDARQWARVVEGLYYTLLLSVACVIFSVVIGIVGAWAQGSPSRLLRSIVQGYIQFFRNTPPFVQLLFFYFALGQFTPTYSPDGWLQVPIISNVGWAIISLSFFAGAFNVEIFRAGIEAVPESTREASESLGFSRLQTYRWPSASRCPPSTTTSSTWSRRRPRPSPSRCRNCSTRASPSGTISPAPSTRPC